jgi:DNA invertase Pin-like site-specific DNA recombinase
LADGVEPLKSAGIRSRPAYTCVVAVDTTHAQGRMIFGILAVMAEFERN